MDRQPTKHDPRQGRVGPSAREVLRIKQEFQSVLAPGLSQAAHSARHPRSCWNADTLTEGAPAATDQGLSSCCQSTRAMRWSTSPCRGRGRGSCSQHSRQRVRAMDDPGSQHPGLCSESDKRYSREQRAPFESAVLCTVPQGEKGSLWVHHGCFGFGLINAQFLIFRVYQSNYAAGDLWGFN